MKLFQGTVAQLLAHLGQAFNMSEGRRMVAQGAVKINGKIITDLTQVFDFKPSDSIQIGSQDPFYVGQYLGSEQ